MIISVFFFDRGQKLKAKQARKLEKEKEKERSSTPTVDKAQKQRG